MNSRKYKDAFKENDIINGFTFLKLDGLYGRSTAAIFKCKHCYKEFRKPIHDVVSGRCKSCGCKNWTGAHSVTHGATKKGSIFPEFRIWSTMKERCHNANNKMYPNYGARGISVCEEWMNSFAAFIEYVGRRPSKEYSLDRWPNNDGNYEPGNVRWATRIEQMANRRKTINITYKGQTKPLADWCRQLGISYRVTRSRLNRFKWGVEKSFETPTLPVGHNYRSYKKPSNTFISHSFGYIR